MPDGPYDFDFAYAALKRHEYDFVVEYVLRHATAGNADAQCMAGFLYQYGFGVSVDLREAEKWLLKATEQNSALAWNNLGSLYLHEGCTLPHMRKRAHECYTRAKELGFNCAEPYPPPFLEE